MSSADWPGRMSASWRLPSLSMQRICLPSAEKETFSIRLLRGEEEGVANTHTVRRE